MAAKKKAAKKKTAKKAVKKAPAKKKATKKKAATKKCYIVKSGASWTARTLATDKKICGSTKSREACKKACEEKGYKAIPFKQNPKK